MSQSSHRPQSDRNLLFGILAVQMQFISRDDLVQSMANWVRDKEASLGRILHTMGKLNAEQVQALDGVVTQILHAHGDNAEECLHMIPGASTVASWLTPIDDPVLQSSVAAVLGEVSTAEFRPEAQNGRYRKGRFHKKGGQGEVYRARDLELDREIAWKELRADYRDHAESRARLVREARITGGLTHPGIVPVYGLCAGAKGEPYYAMRFIDEDRFRDAITAFHEADAKPNRHAAERSLAFRQLLRRFIDVCNTIAYAHDRGVIHRDLKPSNVMLGKFGQTLVIDWGLARPQAELTQPEAAIDVEPPLQLATTLGIHTEAGMFMGTAEYASPEQAACRADLMGPASDVYSLGTVFYNLLTGQLPYKSDAEDKRVRLDEVLTKVKKGQFRPPMEVKPETPAALDAICRKAMSRERGDRYASATALAADIESWLADESVSAYAEPLPARLGRWARRHQKTVVGVIVASVVAAVALAISTALVSAEQRETEKQRQAAVAEEKKTAAQKKIAEDNHVLARAQFLSGVELIQAADVHFASDPALHPKRKELLKAALQACRDFKNGADDPELQRQAAVVYRFAANVHRMSDETEAAEPLYKDALGLYEAMAKGQPRDDAVQLRLAETLRDQASFFMKIGRLKEARANLERVQTLVADLHKGDPANPATLQVEGNVHLNLALIKHRLGDDGALGQTEKAMTIFVKLAQQPAGTGHPYNALFLAAARNQLAMLQRETGEAKKARETHRDVVKPINELQVKDAAGIAPADYFSLKAHCALEQCKTLMEFPDAKVRQVAKINLDQNVTHWHGLAAAYPWIPYYRNRHAVSLLTRGLLSFQDKDFEKAFADYDASRRLLEKQAESHPRVPAYHADLGRCYAGLGRVMRAQNKRADIDGWIGKAEESLRRAIKMSPDDRSLRQDLDAIHK